MTTYPTIERQIPDTAVVGLDTQSIGCIIGTSFYSCRIGDAALFNGGLRSYRINGGTQILANGVNAALAVGQSINGPYCSLPTRQGFIYATGKVYLVDPATLTAISSWDISAVPNYPTLPAVPQSFGATSQSGYSYIACAKTSTQLPAEVYIMQSGPTATQPAGYTFNPVNTVTETQLFSGPGPTGKAYALSCGANAGFSTACGVYEISISAGAENYNLALWPTMNPNITHTQLGTFLPPDVDPAWSTMNYLSAPGYDKQTGNLIAFATTADAVLNQSYCIMISSTDGSIVWANAVSGSNERFNAMPNSDIDGGFYNYIQNRNLYQINTATGVMSTTALSSIGLTQTCSIDSHATESLFMYGQWLQASTPPYPVGGITPTATEYWYNIQLADIPTPPPGSAGRKFIAMLGPVRVYS